MCTACSLGLMLETPSDVVPSSRDAFLVVDRTLLVQAMSTRAEALLGVSEDAAVHHPVTELLVPAAAETNGPSAFAQTILEAASGPSATASAFVRPWNTFGVRMRVRVAPCGPPRAALLVLDPQVGKLRAVGR